MKKILLTVLACCSICIANAQDFTSNLLEQAAKKGLVVLRQDYQILNEDDDPIGNKPGFDCYGRTYSCGVRVNDDEFLVTKDFIMPWANESLVKSDKRHPEISYSGFLALNTIEFEQIDASVESAEEVIENHLYKVGASEIEGFAIDEEYGKKRGYALWIKSANAFSLEKAPSGLTIEIVPFSITTTEKSFVYDLTKQPTGNVVGGVFIVPSSPAINTILLKVNGMFEKRGGVWKFISLGREESIE